MSTSKKTVTSTSAGIERVLLLIKKIRSTIKPGQNIKFMGLEIVEERLQSAHDEAFAMLATKNPDTGKFSIPKDTKIVLHPSIIKDVRWIEETFFPKNNK